MKPNHIVLATLVAVIWGLAYVATRIALDGFSPPQLTALRFLIACVPILFLPRPRIPWFMLVSIGLTMFAGQFLLQFFGIANGMPPGLASVVSQTQGMFTVLLAVFMLGERPTGRQLVGMIAGLTGLAMIGLTVGQGLTMIGLILVLASAISWSIGNVLLKRLPPVDMLNLVVWLSIVPPLPALALSSLLEGPLALPKALADASWPSIGAALYLGAIATVVAYAIWARLLHLYSAVVVTPFALLAPCVGALSSAIVFGEQFGPLRLAGMAAIIVGLAIVLLPIEGIAKFCIGRFSAQDE